MEMTCFKIGCRSPIVFECLCRILPLFSCIEHWGEHQIEKGNHSATKTLLTLNESEIKEISNDVFILKNRFKKIKQMITREVSDIIKNNIEFLKKFKQKIKEYEKKCIEISKNIKISKSIHKVDRKKLEEWKKIVVQDIQFEKINIKIHKFFKNLEKKLLITKSNDVLSEKYEKIYFFEDNLNKLNKIDLIKSNDSAELINIEIDVDTSTLVHSIYNNNYIFIYGGGKPQTGYFAIYDVKLSIIRHEGITQSNSFAGMCKRKKSLFILGGISYKRILNTNLEFNLKTFLWKNLNCLPEPVFSATAVVQNEQIFVTGSNVSSFYVYNIKNDNYSTLFHFHELPKFSFKIALKGNSQIFVIHGKSIFEIHNNIADLCEIRNEIRIENCLLKGAPVRNSYFIYFVLSNNFLYRFDPRNKHLTQIRFIDPMCFVSK